MKINKKIISLTLILIMFFIPYSTYASTVITNKVTQQATPINFDEGVFTKKITNIENNEVTIELNLSINNKKVISSNSEILFLIDNSSSMGTVLEDKVTTRKTKVVSSTQELIKKINNNNPNVKMGIVSFSSGAQIIQNFTNDRDTLINTCENFKGQNPGGNTSMATALNTSKQVFSPDVKNKILVLLTDGFPTDGDTATKAQLQDDNVYIISTLVVLNNLDAANETYIQSIFGTEQNPTADKFYNIADSDIETTISKNIYDRILDDFKSSITNVVIKDYFPEEIMNNYNIEIGNVSKGEFTKKDNTILWSLDELKIGQNAILNYTLKLKDGYDANIIEKVLNTNQKVEFEFINLMGNNENREMTDTPQIEIITQTIQKQRSNYNNDNNTDNKQDVVSVNENNKLKKSDTTITNSQIPYTGTNTFIIIAICIGFIVSFVLKRKMDSIGK